MLLRQHNLATFKIFFRKCAQKNYGYSNGDEQICTVVREVLHKIIISQSHWSLPHLDNKPKKFNFVHLTVSRREAHTRWA